MLATFILLATAAAGHGAGHRVPTMPQSSKENARPDSPKGKLLAQPRRKIEYSSFKGADRELYPWKGPHIAFLTRSNDLDRVTMTRLVEVFEGVHVYYERATGREPERFRHLDGRLTIAEEPVTYGAGCGYLGRTGIELMPEYFGRLYDQIRETGEVDQVLPYELGRNFWFYDAQLRFVEPDESDAFVTGFAVLMRFWSLEAVGCGVGPFGQATGVEFRQTVESLVDVYEKSATSTFDSTLRAGRGIENSLGLGATDLFASFLMRLRRESPRPDFPARVWRYLGAQPEAARTEDSVDNLVVAASLAAGVDFGDTFEQRWRFPVSAAARVRIRDGLESGHEPPAPKRSR